MNKLKPISKILLFVTVSFFSIWLGSYIARQISVYQLFEPIELNLRPLYNTNNLPAIHSVIIPLLILNIISYTVFLITFIIFLFISRIKLKENGWLFIISLIVFITAPFEIYLLLIDYNIITLGLRDLSQSTALIELIKERLIKLSSFSLIEIFSYIAIIFLTIFKPFQKKYEN